jgi:hypothetical protein
MKTISARIALRLLTLSVLETALIAADLPFTPVDGGPLTSGRREYLSAAWGDYDGDGRPDVYLAAVDTGAGELFRNSIEGFQRITQGVVATDTARRTAAAWGDCDGDGDLDLFVSTASSTGDQLYRNLGAAGFERIPWTAPSKASFGIATVWADVDGDGSLDLFVANGSGVAAQQDSLFRNLGGGAFEQVPAGDASSETLYSQGASFADYDADGDLDLLVNHLFARSSLFRNANGNLTRTQSGEIGADTEPSASITSAWGDVDNDGDLDLLVITGVNPYRFYTNDGTGQLTRVLSGPVANAGGDGAGGVWVDFDNDGWLDLLLPRRSGRPLLFRGTGSGQFAQVTSGALPESTHGANGVAVADYDGDGDIDVLLSHWPGSGSPSLFRNETTGNHWLRVRLEGTASNRSGIGAKVRIRTSVGGQERWQLRQIGGFDSAGSQELLAHFGLGSATTADVIRIEWPSGRVQEIGSTPGDQVLLVTEPANPPIVITPAGGVFTNSVTVTLRSTIAGADIRYTLDGTEPTVLANLYRNPFDIVRATTLKAQLYVNGFPVSEVQSAVYTPDPGVRFAPPAAWFTNRIDVSIVSRIAGTEIRYTVDGTEPTLDSTPFRDPIRLTGTATLKTRAFLNGFPVTEIVSATYSRVYAFDDEGIPPAWRLEHFGPGYPIDPRAAADADPDGDGTSNRQEYVAGTLPLDPLSGFRVGVRAVPEIRFASVPGKVYRILRLTDVNSADSTVVAELTATAAETAWIDVDAGVVVNPAFYVVQPVP